MATKVGDAYIAVTANGQAADRALRRLNEQNQKQQLADARTGGRKVGAEWADAMTASMEKRFRARRNELTDALASMDFSKFQKSGDSVDDTLQRVNDRITEMARGYTKVEDGQSRVVRITKEQEKSLRALVNARFADLRAEEERNKEIAANTKEVDKNTRAVDRARDVQSPAWEEMRKSVGKALRSMDTQLRKYRLTQDQYSKDTSKNLYDLSDGFDALQRAVQNMDLSDQLVAVDKFAERAGPVFDQIKRDQEEYKRLQREAAQESRRSAREQRRNLASVEDGYDSLRKKVADSVTTINTDLDKMVDRTRSWPRKMRQPILDFQKDWDRFRKNLDITSDDVDVDGVQKFIDRHTELTETITEQSRTIRQDIDKTWVGRVRRAFRSNSTAARNLTRDFDGLGNSIKKAGNGFKLPSWRELTSRMDSTVRAVISLIAIAAQDIATLGSAIAASGTAILSSLVYALGVAVPLAGGLVTGLLGVGLAVTAWQDMETTMSGVKDTLDEVSTAWNDQAAAFGEAWGPALEGFLDSVARLVEVSGIGTSLGESFASITDAFTEVINGDGMANFIEALNGPLAEGLALFGDGVANVVDGLLNLFAAAAPGFETLGGMFSDWGQKFSDTMEEMSEDGTIQEFVDRAIDAYGKLSNIVGNLGSALGSVFDVGQESGGRFLDSLEEITDKFDTWANSWQGKQSLRDWFANGEEVMSGMVPLLEGLAEAMGNLVNEDTVDNLVQFMEDLGGFLPTLGQLLGIVSELNILGNLAALLNVLGEAIQPLIDPLTQVADLLGDALYTVITSPEFQAAIGELGEALGRFAEQLVPVVERLLPVLVPLLTSLLEVVTPLIEPIGTLLLGALQGLIPVMENAIKTIEDATAAFEFIAPAVEAMANYVTELIDGGWAGIWDRFLEYVNLAWEGLQQFFTEQIAVFTTSLEAFGNTISELWDETWSTVSEALSNWWNTMVTTISDQIGKASTFVSDGMADIQGFFSEAWDAIWTALSTFFSSLPTEVQEAIGGLKDTIQEIPGKITTWLSNLWSTASEVGGDIISGLISGISNNIAGVRDALFGGINSAIATVKDWLGIGSPSKYMRDEVGQWIPEGLAVGIDRHMGAVTSAGEQMVNALTESTTMDSMIAAGIDAAERFANGVRDVDMPTLTPKVGDPEYRPSGGFGYGPGDGGGSGLGGGSQVVFEAGAIVVQTPAKDPLIVAEQVADVIAERQAEKAY